MRHAMTRRDWLLTGAAAFAGVAAGDAPAAQPAAKSSGLRLGLVTYNLAKDWDLPTIIKNCQTTGFASVELRTTHAHGVEPSLSKAQRAETRRRFDDSPVELFGLGTTCEFQSPDPATVRKNIAMCGEFIDLAADVGAKAVKVRPNGLPAGVAVEKTLEQIGAALAECGAMAAERGVKLYMEVHGGGTQEPANAAAIMRHANHPNVYCGWNSNKTDVKDGSVKEAFELLRPTMLAAHLRDLYLPDYPFREFFSLLKASGFSGPTLAEIPPSEDPIRVMHYFRALWQAYAE